MVEVGLYKAPARMAYPQLLADGIIPSFPHDPSVIRADNAGINSIILVAAWRHTIFIIGSPSCRSNKGAMKESETTADASKKYADKGILFDDAVSSFSQESSDIDGDGLSWGKSLDFFSLANLRRDDGRFRFDFDLFFLFGSLAREEVGVCLRICVSLSPIGEANGKDNRSIWCFVALPLWVCWKIDLCNTFIYNTDRM